MAANPQTLEKISGIVKAELPKYLSREFVICDVMAENRPEPHDEDYVHVHMVLEDGHTSRRSCGILASIRNFEH